MATNIDFDFNQLPTIYQQRVKLYLIKHQDPGPFLRHVLGSQLFKAVLTGSEFDLQCLPQLVAAILYADQRLGHTTVDSQLPWGSEEKVNAWLALGRSREARVAALRGDEAGPDPG